MGGAGVVWEGLEYLGVRSTCGCSSAKRSAGRGPARVRACPVQGARTLRRPTLQQPAHSLCAGAILPDNAARPEPSWHFSCSPRPVTQHDATTGKRNDWEMQRTEHLPHLDGGPVGKAIGKPKRVVHVVDVAPGDAKVALDAWRREGEGVGDQIAGACGQGIWEGRGDAVRSRGPPVGWQPQRTARPRMSARRVLPSAAEQARSRRCRGEPHT